MKKFSLFIATLFLLSSFEATDTKPPHLRNFGASCYINALIQTLYAANPLTMVIPTLHFDNPSAQQYQKLIVSIKQEDQQAIDGSLFDFYNSIKNIFAAPIRETIEEKETTPKSQKTVQKLKISSEEKKQIQQAKAASLEASKKTTQRNEDLINTIARAKNADFDTVPVDEKKIIKQSIQEVLTIFGQQPQQDAHEFLTGLIDLLRGNNQQADTYKTIKDLIFFTTTDNQPNSIINIPTYRKDKEGPLNFAFQEGKIFWFDKINPFKTIYEGFKTTLNQHDKIITLSSVFMVSLIRYVPGNNVENQKIEIIKTAFPIKIPFTLDLADFVLDNADTLYELHAVIIHKGQASGGHYFAYVKENNEWYLCNDMDIKTIDYKNKKFRKEISKHGYILLYQQQPKRKALESNLKKLRMRLKKLASLLKRH